MGDHDEDLRGLLASVWETLFARRLDSHAPDPLPGVTMVSSYVSIEGNWQGGILIEIPIGLANDLTAEILVLDGEPSREQMCDAMGEFCNVVAGNFKALVPGPSQLSLPVVTLGSDYHLQVVGARSASSLSFSDGGRCFLVTVHEGAEATL